MSTDERGLISVHLEQLLAAIHADDPKRELLVRVGDLMREVQALPAAQAADGWQIVPKEPTIEMYRAALEFSLARMTEYGVDGLSPFKDYPPLRETTFGMYRAMLAVAPSLIAEDRT